MSDLIDRQAAIEVADAIWSVTGDKNVAKVWDQIKDLPSAQPETHGKHTETHACDSISRQKAINTVKKMRAVCDTDSIEDYEALLETAIEALPSAQSEPQWIPCSERLPHGSCSDLVNVSIHDDSGDTPFDYTSCGWVTTDGEYWIVDNEINNHVVAWMPLPEPYKGEQE